MATNIEEPNILVVEGKEEERFFGALIKHLGLQRIQIMPMGGRDKLLRNLKALAVSPGFSGVTFLGIAMDADADPNAAFQSIRNALQGARLPAPDSPSIPVGERPRVAVLILPEAYRRGMLEDLCLESVAQDPAMCCVEEYFKCLQQKALSLPNNMSKAKVQVFLASRSKPGLRLGEAAEAGYWPWNGNAFKQVKDFLQKIVQGASP
jgi:hypothetical protein